MVAPYQVKLKLNSDGRVSKESLQEVRAYWMHTIDDRLERLSVAIAQEPVPPGGTKIVQEVFTVVMCRGE